MNISYELKATEKPADANAQEGEAFNPDNGAKGNQLTGDGGSDKTWEGRFKALDEEAKLLRAQADNGRFLSGKVIEVQDKLKAAEELAAKLESADYKAYLESKNKPAEEDPLFSDEEKAALIDDLGERAAKVFMAKQQRVMDSLTSKLKGGSALDVDLAKRVDGVDEALKNSEFLGGIEAVLRGKVINDNSDFMKWAADQKDGRTSTKANEIKEILKSRDQSSIGYIQAAYADYEATKSTRAASPPAGDGRFATAPKNISGGMPKVSYHKS